jgi:hypothetical protein
MDPLAILAVCVIFGGIYVADRLFSPAAMKTKPIRKSEYVPHHIDQNGDIVMTKKIDIYK